MNWVLLHGFTGSGRDFDPLRSALALEADGVVAPDWPGHGERSGMRRPTDFTLEAHLRLIDEAIGSPRGPVTLLGYSLGGRLLQHWLASRTPVLPQGSRVILVSTSPGLASPEARRERVRGDAAVARLLREEGLVRFLHYWHSQTMFQPLLRLPPGALSPVLRRRGACDPEGLALSLEHVGAGAVGDTWRMLDTLRHPTLLVAGELDRRYVEHGQAMLARLPNAALQIIAGAGHALHLERPAALAGLIRHV